jgi:hypothetical protein
VIGVEAEIAGKRASHENFRQLRELFYDQHGDYQVEIYTRVDMRGTNHEIKIGNMMRHERTKVNNIIH